MVLRRHPMSQGRSLVTCLINTSPKVFNNVFTLNTSGDYTIELVFILVFMHPLLMCLFKNIYKGIKHIKKIEGVNSYVWSG